MRLQKLHQFVDVLKEDSRLYNVQRYSLRDVGLCRLARIVWRFVGVITASAGTGSAFAAAL